VIKLGAILSLTGAGSVFGPQSLDGMKLAVDQINASGGVNGATIQVSYNDDASSETQSTQIAQTLIRSEHDLALAGPTLPNSAAVVDPLADSLKTPILGIGSTGIHAVPDCRWTIANPDATACKYVFRESLGEQTAIPDNIMSYANDAHPRTGVLFVALDDNFSIDCGKIVQDEAGRHGIQLLRVIRFYKGEADLSLHVAEAIQLKPDVIFITSLGDLPARLMRVSRALGWTGQFLGGNGFNAAEISRQAAASGKGAQSASAWYLGDTFPASATFVSTYRARYSADPDQFAAQGYAAIKILADAAKRANLTFSDVAGDRDRLRAAMETVSIDTPLGPFHFTPAHDVKQTVWIVQMDGQGGFKLVHQVNP
jgi:branched-chain amino acid transport system substrate-binding protein